MQPTDFWDEWFLPGELDVAKRIPHRCEVCFQILDAPLASVCGHVICTDCVVKTYGGAYAQVGECKFCRAKSPGWHRAVTVEFQLKTLKVRCPWALINGLSTCNTSEREQQKIRPNCILKECPWTGNLSDHKEHLKKCAFYPFKCEYDCGRMITRTVQDEHLEWCLFEREIDCKLCGATCIGYNDLSEGHRHVCPEMNVGCAYCGKITLRKEHATHIAECEEAPITCDKCGTYPFKRKDMRNHLVINCPAVRIQCTCGQRVTRAQMTEHKKDPAAAVLHLKALEEENANLKRQVEKMQYAVAHEAIGRPKLWKPSEVKAKAKAMEVDSEEDDDEDQRKCVWCSKPLYRRTSHTAKNPGRMFWTHNSSDHLPCSMFMWEDGRP